MIAMQRRGLISLSLKHRLSCSTALFCSPWNGLYTSSSSFFSRVAIDIAASFIPWSHWEPWVASSEEEAVGACRCEGKKGARHGRAPGATSSAAGKVGGRREGLGDCAGRAATSRWCAAVH